MKTINLRDFYPWYTRDEFVNVPDVVAAELFAGRRYDKSHKQRIRRNKSFYSIDVDDGIEAAAIVCYDDSPERIFDLMERHCRLCHALNALPEIQGRRIESHFLHGISMRKISKTEGVSLVAVHKAIKKGLYTMKKQLNDFHLGG